MKNYNGGIYMFQGFEHTAIAAQDTKKLADWYCRVFDLKVVYDNKKEPATYMLKAPDGTMLEIVPATNSDNRQYEARDKGIRHIAIKVVNFQEASNKLEGQGVTFFENKTLQDGGKLAFFRDPEGNILHLMWRTKEL